MVLETAVNGRADRLVTFDRKDFRFAGARDRHLLVTRRG